MPKKQRRPCPTRPNDFERVISGELKGQDLKTAMLEYNNQAFDDFNKKALVKCKNCDRTFLPRPLEIHQRSCRPKPEGNSQGKTSAETKFLWPSKLPLVNLGPFRSGHYLNFFVPFLLKIIDGETLFSSVPPSNSLVSVLDPRRAF